MLDVERIASLSGGTESCFSSTVPLFVLLFASHMAEVLTVVLKKKAQRKNLLFCKCMNGLLLLHSAERQNWQLLKQCEAIDGTNMSFKLTLVKKFAVHLV